MLKLEIAHQQLYVHMCAQPSMKNGCDCVTEEAHCCVVVLLLEQCVNIPGNGAPPPKKKKNPLTHPVSLTFWHWSFTFKF
jgi:hypothetical protein